MTKKEIYVHLTNKGLELLKELNTARRKHDVDEVKRLVYTLRGYIHAFGDMGFIYRSTELRLCKFPYDEMSRVRAKNVFLFYLKMDKNFPASGCDLDLFLKSARCFE